MDTAGKALKRAIVGGGGTISRDVGRERASTSVLRSGTQKSQLVSAVTTTSSIKAIRWIPRCEEGIPKF